MNKIKLFLISAAVFVNTFVLGLALPATVFAQGAVDQNVAVNCTDLQGQNGLNVPCTANLSKLISTVVTIIFIVAALLALFFLIFGGIKWMLSGGSKEGTEGARKMITAAIIGLAIVFLSFIVIKILGDIFGFNLSSLHIPSFSEALK